MHSPAPHMQNEMLRENTATVQLDEEVLHTLLRCSIVIFNGSEITVW